MPGYNGTGPSGMGPRSGGGLGYCPPGTAPVNTGTGVVYGVGRGGIPRGGGRGRAFGGGRGGGINSVVAPIPLADEADMLKQRQGFLKTVINGIEKRIKDIEIKP